MSRVKRAYMPYPPVISASALPTPPTIKARKGFSTEANSRRKPSPRLKYPCMPFGTLSSHVARNTRAIPSATVTISFTFIVFICATPFVSAVIRSAFCSFKNIHRQSDLTLADYWGIEKDYPKKNDNKGVSLVMIHSEKGKQIFSELYNSMDVFLVDYKNSIIENKSLLQSIKINNLSQKFYKDLKKLPFNTLIEKYCGNKITSKFRRKIAQMRQ